MAESTRILIVRSAFGEMHELAWVRALRELGVDVELFDTHRVIGQGLSARVQERLLWGPGVWRARRLLIERVAGIKPEITLFYHGHHYNRGTLTRLKPFTFVAGYHNDDPFGPRAEMLRYRLLREALPSYDGYHVYRDCNVEEMKAAGVPRVAVLRSYYLPWCDYPRELSAEESKELDCDVLFAGHPENDARIAALSTASRQGLKVRIYGYLPNWERWLPEDVQKNTQPRPALEGEGYRKAICAARVVACFFSRWNRDQYTRRVFEVPACGGFLLAERTPVMQALYAEGKEAEFFSTADEFADKASFYTRNPSVRHIIARAGMKRAVDSGYDIVSRMRQWLGDVREWRAHTERSLRRKP